MMEKIFTIYVCTYNGEKIIGECLQYLLKLKKLHELVDKIVVVDNNSSDLTKEIIRNYSINNDVIHYEFEGRQGLAFARKHAAYAITDWVIYVDDDNLLDENWLVELYRVVHNNSKIGVVNGAVIAYPKERLDYSEENCLKVIYRDLACTNFGDEDVTNATNKLPMGAGMCIKTTALQEINKNGWIKLIGRNGEFLSSGEDGELCNRVFELGFSYLFNPKMKLWHVIPKNRLEIDYVKKLIEGLVDGRIKYFKTLRFGEIQCFLRRIKYSINMIKIRCRKREFDYGSFEYWKDYVEKIITYTYIKKL